MGSLTVDGDTPLSNEDFGVPSRDVAGPGDQLLESFDDPSGRKGRSRVSTTSAGGTWSASGGRSCAVSMPSFSRNSSVVPYSKACPGPGRGSDLADQAAPLERVERPFRIYTTDFGDLAAGDGLPIRHDRERLERRIREAGCTFGRGEALQIRQHVGGGVEPPTAGDGAQHDAGPPLEQFMFDLCKR